MPRRPYCKSLRTLLSLEAPQPSSKQVTCSQCGTCCMGWWCLVETMLLFAWLNTLDSTCLKLQPDIKIISNSRWTTNKIKKQQIMEMPSKTCKVHNKTQLAMQMVRAMTPLQFPQQTQQEFVVWHQTNPLSTLFRRWIGTLELWA